MSEVLFAIGIPLIQVAGLLIVGLIFRVDCKPGGDE